MGKPVSDLNHYICCSTFVWRINVGHPPVEISTKIKKLSRCLPSYTIASPRLRGSLCGTQSEPFVLCFFGNRLIFSMSGNVSATKCRALFWRVDKYIYIVTYSISCSLEYESCALHMIVLQLYSTQFRPYRSQSISHDLPLWAP